MSRFINWVLIMIAIAAGVALVADGLHPEDLFHEDTSVLLRIAAAVPAVILAIRWHSDRSNAAADARLAEYETRMYASYAEMRVFITDAFAQHAARMEAVVADHAKRMETSVDTHADRTGKRTLESALGAMARMVTQTEMEAADRASFRLTDTGPFRMPR